MPVMSPPVSLIISTRNRPALIRDTVLSVLSGQDLPAEIVLIDQSDRPDDALAGLEMPPGVVLKYAWRQERGVSRGKNAGIEIASYDLLAIIDDDMFVAPDWLRCLISGLQDGSETCVATGKVLPAPVEGKGDFVPSTIHDDRPAVYSGRVERDALYAGNMAAYKSVIEQVGGFDERLGVGTPFPSGDDNDLGFRILEAGYKICYLPSAVVYHRAWRPNSDFNRLRWGYGIGRGAYYAKHLHLRDPYMLRRLAVDIYQHTIQFPFNIRRKRQQAVGDLILAAGLLVGSLRWLIRHPRRAIREQPCA